MKKKAMLVVLFVVMGLAALSIGNAEAAWYTCTISQAGATATGYWVITLTDTAATPAFTNRTFFISTVNAHQKDMYAAALTAFANSTNVSCNIPSPAAGGYVISLYATK